MKMNINKIMFLYMMILSIIMILTSNNFMFTWMSMEINMISILPILTKTKKMKDQVMKYFIIQSTASLIMLTTIILEPMLEKKLENSVVFMMSMMMKLGMMPFHLWMPTIMQVISWNTCMLMTSIQKIPGTMILGQLTKTEMLILPMSINLILAPLSAMNQLSMKKIMAYSSITNSPWMISSMKMSKMKFMMFMTIYFSVNIMIMKTLKKKNIMFINQMMMTETKMKMKIMIMNLTISGMPPTVGFFMKWMILKNMMYLSTAVSISMIISSTMSTMVYLKMMSTMMLKKSMTKKKTMKKKSSMKNEMIINTIGLPMFLMNKSN